MREIKDNLFNQLSQPILDDADSKDDSLEAGQARISPEYRIQPLLPAKFDAKFSEP